MKRKILLSIFVLMLTCFITLGCVGCDAASNPDTLDITGVTIGQVTQTFGSQQELMDAKRSAFTAFTIVYKDVKSDGTEVEKTFTSYDSFIAAGGTINGFNVSQAPGEYKMTFSYNGITSIELAYTLVKAS